MAVGPVDVDIIGFPGNKFSGRIAPAMMDLVDSGTIRVIDLLFVMKDADGVVTTIEAADIDEEGRPSSRSRSRSQVRSGRRTRRRSATTFRRTARRC